MNTAKMLGVLLATVTLVGCMGRTPEQRMAEIQNACTSYGFTAGTENYAYCMMQLDIAMAQQDQAARQHFAQSMQQLAAQNRSVTCNTHSSVYGSRGFATGNATTTCR